MKYLSFAVLFAFCSMSSLLAADIKEVEGILRLKKGKATLYVNPLSRSQITIELQNPSFVKTSLKTNDFSGPAKVKLRVFLYDSLTEIRAAAQSIKKINKRKNPLPIYSSRLELVLSRNK